ncbi:Uncharacterised protein [Neisseria gonorrhoeae]|uniref:DNA mimic protein DMP19 C-terminal domain-containing protein n=1 Tax=Neisseria gonorrhoeae TaxID=485 RepID=A0A378VTT0_NEIGO|nr:Uncharacterised protein [Neisseria gonorrhoeae]
MTALTLPEDIRQQEPSVLLYTLVSAYLEHTAQTGDESLSCLSDDQHTLTAFCYLDSQVEEGGFVQLIASGYGEYIFRNPLADSLRRWKSKPCRKSWTKPKPSTNNTAKPSKRSPTEAQTSNPCANSSPTLKNGTAHTTKPPNKTCPCLQNTSCQTGRHSPISGRRDCVCFQPV